MKKVNIFTILLTSMISLVLITSCDEENVLKPIDNDNSAPGQIFNVIVDNQPGAALITYTLPSDDDLLYVLASYKRKDGSIAESRSSYYTNQIKIEGFGDTSEYEVDLYAVDRSENRSKPVKVKVNPLTPQVLQTAESIIVDEDFGGMSFTFKNDTKAILSFIVLTTDETGDIVVTETFFTQRDSAKFAVRGFIDEERWFGIIVRDKWKNVSDTISVNLVPIYERLLDKSLFKSKIFPNDSPATSWGGALEYIWDGKADDRAAHTGNDVISVPKHISFDLGVEAKLSRMNIKTIQDDKHWFNDVSLRYYEIWGSNDPDLSGSFDTWIKLATVENVKPSGLSIGVLTEDDRTAGRNGDDVDIPIDMPKIRYLRIVSTKNWSGNTNMCISEVSVWGNDK